MKKIGFLIASGLIASTPTIAQDAASEVAEQAAAVEQAAPVASEAPAVIQQAVAPPAAKTKTVTLPANTDILFSMDKALATDKRERVEGEPKPPKNKRRLTNVGDTFTMTVINDIEQDGAIIIPAGSIGHGEVIYVTGRGGFGKSGKIEIEMKYVQVGENQYPLIGTYLQKGKGRGGAAIAGTIIAGALAGVFIKGSEADIPLQAEIKFRTKEDITTEVEIASYTQTVPEQTEVAEVVEAAANAEATPSQEDITDDNEAS